MAKRPKRTIGSLLASGKASRFKETGFDLLNEADRILVNTSEEEPQLSSILETSPSPEGSVDLSDILLIPKSEKNIALNESSAAEVKEQENTVQTPCKHRTNTVVPSIALEGMEPTVIRDQDQNLTTKAEEPQYEAQVDFSHPSPQTSKAPQITVQIPYKYRINDIQSPDKHRTNDVQTPYNVRTNTHHALVESAAGIIPRTNTVQSPYIPPTNNDKIPYAEEKEEHSPPPYPVQTPNEHRTQERTDYRTNTVQTPYKTEAHNLIRFSLNSLVGVRRSIVLFLYSSCKAARSRTTDPIALSNLATACNASLNTIEITIRRLVSDQLIRRVESKSGRGGWTIYELADRVYEEILREESGGRLDRITVLSPYKPGTQDRTQDRTSIPSSSSFLNSSEELKTNTREPSSTAPNELPSDWADVDYSALHDLEIHFGKEHVRQIYSRKWCATAKDLQESLNHFAFFMANVRPEKAPKQPIHVFMAALRDGHYYGRPEGYLSPEEQAEKARLQAEEKKAEQLRHFQQQRFNALFEQWFASLKGTEINALTPGIQGYDEKKKFLNFYFLDHFWLEIKDNPTVDVTTLRFKTDTDATDMSASTDVVSTVSEEEFQAAFKDLDRRVQNTSQPVS